MNDENLVTQTEICRYLAIASALGDMSSDLSLRAKLFGVEDGRLSWIDSTSGAVDALTVRPIG